MGRVENRGIKLPSVRTMIRDGAAAALLFSAAGCGTSAATRPVSTENPQACATAQPTPLESPTPYLVNPAEFDKLESQAIKEIESEFNVLVDENPGTLYWPETYLFAYDPGAKEALGKSLSLFSAGFYSTPDGRRITIVLDGSLIDGRVEFTRNAVYIPAWDLVSGDRLDSISSLDWDLADVLAQRKDSDNGNQTTKQIIKILGGEKFVKNPASLYQRFVREGEAFTGDPADVAFPKKADGSIDTSRLVGALAEYYIMDNEANFVDDIGSIVSPGVSITDDNYSSSRVHQVYEALRMLFDGRTYGLPAPKPNKL